MINHFYSLFLILGMLSLFQGVANAPVMAQQQQPQNWSELGDEIGKGTDNTDKAQAWSDFGKALDNDPEAAQAVGDILGAILQEPQDQPPQQ